MRLVLGCRDRKMIEPLKSGWRGRDPRWRGSEQTWKLINESSELFRGRYHFIYHLLFIYLFIILSSRISFIKMDQIWDSLCAWICCGGGGGIVVLVMYIVLGRMSVLFQEGDFAPLGVVLFADQSNHNNMLFADQSNHNNMSTIICQLWWRRSEESPAPIEALRVSDMIMINTRRLTGYIIFFLAVLFGELCYRTNDCIVWQAFGCSSCSAAGLVQRDCSRGDWRSGSNSSILGRGRRSSSKDSSRRDRDNRAAAGAAAGAEEAAAGVAAGAEAAAAAIAAAGVAAAASRASMASYLIIISLVVNNRLPVHANKRRLIIDKTALHPEDHIAAAASSLVKPSIVEFCRARSSIVEYFRVFPSITEFNRLLTARWYDKAKAITNRPI